MGEIKKHGFYADYSATFWDLLSLSPSPSLPPSVLSNDDAGCDKLAESQKQLEGAASCSSGFLANSSVAPTQHGTLAGF